MSIGLIGKKCGMSRLFIESGESIPVTVLEILPNPVVQVKTHETDGYSALQVASGIPAKRISKPEAGHLAKANVAPVKELMEFRVSKEEIVNYKVGHQFDVSLFSEGQYVDVSGKSRGHGFSGCVKRHGFSTQDASHGNSISHRAPGSTGMCQTPGRVFKGKKMAGQFGNVKRTSQNLKVVRIDLEKNMLLVSGGVPGAPDGLVVVTPAMKKSGQLQKVSGE